MFVTGTTVSLLYTIEVFLLSPDSFAPQSERAPVEGTFLSFTILHHCEHVNCGYGFSGLA